MKKNTKKKGFTLIELIIVIAILGILAAIAIPRFSNYRESAAKSADIATAKTIANVTSVLMADGKISKPNAAATYTLSTADTDATAGLIEDALNEMPQSQVKEKAFVVGISTTGAITITSDGEQVYPTAADAWK